MSDLPDHDLLWFGHVEAVSFISHVDEQPDWEALVQSQDFASQAVLIAWL